MDMSKSSSKGKGRQKKKENHYTAKTADPHALYQEAVQCPEVEVKFINRVFKKRFGRKPSVLREDFCGTAILCCEWVKARKANRAVGVDIDDSVLDWGRAHNIAALGDDERERVTLVQEIGRAHV